MLPAKPRPRILSKKPKREAGRLARFPSNIMRVDWRHANIRMNRFYSFFMVKTSVTALLSDWK